MNAYKGWRNMKRVILFTAVLLIFALPLQAFADNATAYTYTISEEGNWIRTQDAYLVGSILFKNSELSNPEDIFIKNNKIYIADTGNSRILVLDMATGETLSLGDALLDMPTGVYVDDDGNILVADYGLDSVVKMSQDGQLIKKYERPSSILFGENASYKPRKVVSDKKGNIYVVSEGSYDGIIQLSKEGEFLGYFGGNKVFVSFADFLENMLFTEKQKAQLFNKIPSTFYNIAVNKKGLVYSVTQGQKGNAIKKHSVSGKNILKRAGKMIDEINFVDLTVGAHDQIYAVTETGLIYEYDSEGDVLFSFGGRAISTERNGLFTVASGIAVDDSDNVYVLDKERGIVHVFYPTSFATMTHDALVLFENGKYLESKDIWAEILKLSGNSRIANNGMGKGYFQAGEYTLAAKYFKIANNKNDYSYAYWEIRNNWLQKNAGITLIGAFILWFIVDIAKYANKRWHLFDNFRKFNKHVMAIKLIEDLAYVFNFIKHPADSFYYLRYEGKGSVLAATIIYLIAFAVFTANYLFRGFIFNTADARMVSYMYVLVIFFVPIALWIIGNYLISSINEGKGRFRDVYCATAYSFAPFILFMPIVVALSYIATLNEAFLIQFSTIIIWAWTAVMAFIGVREIHNYEPSEALKNILITLFFMFVVVIVISIVYMLANEAVNFIYTIIKEVAYHLEGI